MNNQVLIDRALALRIEDSCRFTMADADRNKLLAALQSPAPEVVEPTVVGYVHSGDLHNLEQAKANRAADIRNHASTKYHVALMTVAQHHAIVSGLGWEVPGGWRLVPVEPTEEMLSALELGLNAQVEGDSDLGSYVYFNSLDEAWDAALSAAPLPPSAKEGGL